MRGWGPLAKARLMRAFAYLQRGPICGAAVLWCAALSGCTSPILSGERTFSLTEQSQTPARASPAPAPAVGGNFHTRILLSAQGLTLIALERPALLPPARYRVIVVPGSGCAGMAPIAPRYFAGLLHAEVLVLHKPWVSPFSATDSAECSPTFVQADALGAWANHASAALQAYAAEHANEPRLPQWLVGLSEGAELLPILASEVPQLAGLVLIGASGLDPVSALQWQAQRLGAGTAWRRLADVQAGKEPDSTVYEGRSLRYWRDLWRWPLEEPLLQSPWPILQVWGGADALVPPDAYERFAHKARHRAAPYCDWRMPEADHGLQKPGRDGVQQVWAWLEQWGRTKVLPDCARH